MSRQASELDFNVYSIPDIEQFLDAFRSLAHKLCIPLRQQNIRDVFIYFGELEGCYNFYVRKHSTAELKVFTRDKFNRWIKIFKQYKIVRDIEIDRIKLLYSRYTDFFTSKGLFLDFTSRPISVHLSGINAAVIEQNRRKISRIEEFTSFVQLHVVDLTDQNLPLIASSNAKLIIDTLLEPDREPSKQEIWRLAYVALHGARASGNIPNFAYTQYFGKVVQKLLQFTDDNFVKSAYYRTIWLYKSPISRIKRSEVVGPGQIAFNYISNVNNLRMMCLITFGMLLLMGQ